jgi:hypothetical protein
MIDYTTILTRRYKDQIWSLSGNDYDGLVWHSNTSKPSKATLDGLWASVQQEIADEATIKAVNKKAVLDRLGITEAEAKLILG